MGVLRDEPVQSEPSGRAAILLIALLCGAAFAGPAGTYLVAAMSTALGDPRPWLKATPLIVWSSGYTLSVLSLVLVSPSVGGRPTPLARLATGEGVAIAFVDRHVERRVHGQDRG
jgi:hypothetical protein